MIVLERVGARAGNFRLHRVSLRVGQGEVLVVLGPSGAGKSVLLQVVAGLRPVDEGRILVGNREITKLPPERRRVAWVPQTPVLYPHLSVWRNITLGWKEHDPGHVKTVAGLLRIEHLLDRASVKGLSGGEAQRIALARAILSRPEVLALDECFASLDPPLRKVVRDAFVAAQRQLQLTTILVTHDREEAFSVADRVAILMDGAVQQVGTREEVWYRPASRRVASFLGITNRLPVERVSPCEGGVICHAGGLPLFVPAERGGLMPEAWLGFSEEDVLLLPASEAMATSPNGGMNVLEAQVLQYHPLGHRAELVLSLSPNRRVQIRARAPQALVRQLGVQPGAQVRIGIPGTAFRILPTA